MFGYNKWYEHTRVRSRKDLLFLPFWYGSRPKDSGFHTRVADGPKGEWSIPNLSLKKTEHISARNLMSPHAVDHHESPSQKGQQWRGQVRISGTQISSWIDAGLMAWQKAARNLDSESFWQNFSTSSCDRVVATISPGHRFFWLVYDAENISTWKRNRR